MAAEVDEPIEVVDYDPEWPRLFEEEAKRLRIGIMEHVECIEHCGSTSVIGMTGKPVVDLLVGVADMAQAHRAANDVEALGYENLGEVFVPGRVYLRRRGPPHFNVLIVVHEGELWEKLLRVRDYLRANPGEVEAYSKSKLAAIQSGARMFLSYSHEKGPFLTGLATRAEHWKLAQGKTG